MLVLHTLISLNRPSRDQSDQKHHQRPHYGRNPSSKEGSKVASKLNNIVIPTGNNDEVDLIVDDAGHWRSDCHGEREESQEGADGLARPAGAAEVEGDGTNEGDEAAVTEPQEAADGEENLELEVPGHGGRGQQHGADTETEQGSLAVKINL